MSARPQSVRYRRPYLISAIELMPVVNLLQFKWDERMHWPAFGMLIKSMSNSEQAVRTAAVAEGKGILSSGT